MKKQWICRLLAMLLVLMLALPCFAVAEDEVIASEIVENPIVDEEEVALDASEEVAEAPAEEAPVEEPVAEAPAEEPAEEVAEEAAEEAPVDEAVEEEAVEALVEEPVAEAEETVLDAPIAQLFESVAVEEEAQSVAEAPSEAPVVEDVAVVDESAEDESAKAMNAANPFAPTAVAIDVSQGTDFWIGMGPSQLNVILEPAGSQTTLKWKSSKKKVAKVDANGLLTPRKAGTSKITVKTGNKKKSTVSVTVHKNIVNLNTKPTSYMFSLLGRAWTIVPKSLERTAGYNYVAKFYLMNGLGRSSRMNNLGLQMYVDGVLVGQKYISKMNIACGTRKSKVFKVTFKASDIIDPSPRLLAAMTSDNVKFVLTTSPTLRCRV